MEDESDEWMDETYISAIQRGTHLADRTDSLKPAK
jgi:hypothetical protein